MPGNRKTNPTSKNPEPKHNSRIGITNPKKRKLLIWDTTLLSKN